MPRGVYDRSITKEQRAAQKSKTTKASAKSAAPKRKYTRRAAVSGDSGPAKMASSPDGAFVMLGEVRQNLTTLSMLHGQFGDLPSISIEVDAQVAAMGQLREKLFSTAEEVSAEQPVEGTVEEETEVSGNGVAPAALQTTVPLPPPPIAPVIPAPH